MWYEYLAAAIAFGWAWDVTDYDAYMARCSKLDAMTDQIDELQQKYGFGKEILAPLMRRKAKEIENGGKGKIDLKFKVKKFSDNTEVDYAGREEEFLISASIGSQGAPISPDMVARMVGLMGSYFEGGIENA